MRFSDILRLQARCFLPTDGAPEHLGDISGLYMGVNPKIGVVAQPPKWMVKIMDPNPIKVDDLVFFPLFLETPI